MMISSFIGLDYGPFIKTETYQMDEGVKKGDMEAMPIFCIGINQATKTTHDSLQEKDAIILSSVDDTYIFGPLGITLPEVKLSLKLNYCVEFLRRNGIRAGCRRGVFPLPAGISRMPSGRDTVTDEEDELLLQSNVCLLQ